jgi:plastocyanin
MTRSIQLCTLVLAGTVLIGTFAGAQDKSQVMAEVSLMQADHSARPFKDNARVVVWLSSIDDPMPRASGKDNHRYQMVQRNKQFEPTLLVVPVGAVVDFPNKDPWFHNVFSLYQGKRFDLGLYQAGSVHSVRFDQPGASYIFCNIHPEMSAVVLAIDSEYYGISGPGGRVSLGDVPPGRYRLHVWYQGSSQKVLDGLQREVTVSAGTHDLGTLRVLANAPSQVAHKNKYGQDYDREDTNPSY